MSSKILTPHPPLHPASVSSPRNKGVGGGGVHTHRAERGPGGQYFGRRKIIGLASYSNNLSTRPGIIMVSRHLFFLSSFFAVVAIHLSFSTFAPLRLVAIV